MTLADERYRALLSAKEFLRSLLDPKQTPKVPRVIRQIARSVLKHYPHEYEVEKLAELAPKILSKVSNRGTMPQPNSIRKASIP